MEGVFRCPRKTAVPLWPILRATQNWEADIRTLLLAITVLALSACTPSSPASVPPSTAASPVPTPNVTAPPTTLPTPPATSIATVAPSDAGTANLVGTADVSQVFTNGEYHTTSTGHAKDVVWKLDPNSTVRPPGVGQNQQIPIKVFLPVSGQLDWSYEALVQGNFTDTCTITDSGTASLASPLDNTAFLFLIGTSPATYSIDANFEAFPTKTCLDSEPQAMDSKWLQSDPALDPQVGGTDNALTLDGTYSLKGTQFGSIAIDYSWSFSSAP